MNVLALTSYPNEAAATRYRVMQFIGPLADRGIKVTVRPFLDAGVFERLYRRNSWARTSVGLLKSTAARVADFGFAGTTDVVFVQREAMLFGPPVFEWLLARVLKLPMVLDLDDATYVSYTSPTYGGVGRVLKWSSKTDDLIRWATVVTCGNRSIAEYVASKGSRARIVPTVVDSSVFQPAPPRPSADPLVLGWIGTHSTFPYLESIFPVLQELAKDYSFRLKIVGAGKAEVSIPGVEVENLPWKLEREVADFQSIDIGLYPIDVAMYSGKWAFGKSGFKAVQYMAVGIPYVATPVGASTEIGTPGVTHFFADSHEEWRQALAKLISDSTRRRTMGAAGRQHVIENYGLSDHADNLADALREAAARSTGA